MDFSVAIANEWHECDAFSLSQYRKKTHEECIVHSAVVMAHLCSCWIASHFNLSLFKAAPKLMMILFDLHAVIRFISHLSFTSPSFVVFFVHKFACLNALEMEIFSHSIRCICVFWISCWMNLTEFVQFLHAKFTIYCLERMVTMKPK